MRTRTRRTAMYNDVCKLLSEAVSYDELLNPIITDTAKEVFCELKSVTQAEFYAAAQSGLRPELKLVLADYYDYDGETAVEYDDKRYKILRTYRTGVSIELICQRDVVTA